MKEISCAQVPGTIPGPVFQRVLQQMAEQGIAPSAVECTFVSRGETVDAVMEQITEHMSAEHSMRSWVREFWPYVRAGVHDVEPA